MVISFRNKKKKNMKKEYMIPQMEVVKLQQNMTLLAGSPDSQNSVPMLDGEINDESLVF